MADKKTFAVSKTSKVFDVIYQVTLDRTPGRCMLKQNAVGQASASAHLFFV